jgi:hypothetical protein
MLVATPPRTSVVRRAAGDEPVPRMRARARHWPTRSPTKRSPWHCESLLCPPPHPTPPHILAAGRPAPTSLRALLRCVVAAADGKKPMMSPPPPPPPVLLSPDEEAAAVQGARRSSCVAHERAQEASLVSGAWTPATRGAGRPVHQGAPGPLLAAPPLSMLPGRCQQGGPVVWIPSPRIVSSKPRSFLAD